MGIFNEHSSNQQIKDHFIRGLQGAPGVGFNLTSTGDYDMVNKKLRNVGNPVSNTDAATKKYVDDHKFDNSEFVKLKFQVKLFVLQILHYRNKSPLTLRLKHSHLRGLDELKLTKRQIARIKNH